MVGFALAIIRLRVSALPARTPGNEVSLLAVRASFVNFLRSRSHASRASIL
jgi:hypothetical protein